MPLKELRKRFSWESCVAAGRDGAAEPILAEAQITELREEANLGRHRAASWLLWRPAR